MKNIKTRFAPHFLLVLGMASNLLHAQPPPAIPMLNSPLVPEFVAPGSAALTLTLNGSDFGTGSIVYWNGSPRQTTYQNCCQIYAEITAADVSTPGSALVTVVNTSQLYGPLVSNSQLFSIAAPLSGVSYTAPISMTSPDANGIVVLGTADFNGDGKPDLIFANNCSSNCYGSTVSVALGNGDGTFSGPNTFAVSSTNNYNVNSVGFVFGDFNHDGKLDLVVLNSYCIELPCDLGNGTFSFLAGNGDGTFQPAVETSIGYDPVAIAAADFDGDGNLDLAFAGVGYSAIPSALYVFLGNGDGTFQTALTVSPAPYPNRAQVAILAGDFNRDGRQDLAVGAGATFILLGNGDGTFQSAIQSPTVNAWGLAGGDLNGDGAPDLVISAPCGQLPGCGYPATIWVLMGNGDGTFQTPVSYSVEDSSSMTPIVLGDFNGDGTLDIMAGNSCGIFSAGTCSGATLSFLAGNGDGTFQPQVQPQGLPSFVGFDYIVAADFNGDGRIDIAVDGGTTGLGAVSSLLTTTLQLSSINLSFAGQNVGGQTSPQSSILTNIATAGNVGIANTKVAGPNPSDFTLTTTCPSQLSPTAQCQVNAVFTPTATGPRTATVAITDSAVGSPHMIALTGTGIAGAIASLSSLALTFASQTVPTTSPIQTVTLTNTGSAALNISSIAASPQFLYKSACGTMLAIGANCTISVAFKPAFGGTQTGTLTITDNAPGSPQTVTLSGTGVYFALSAPSLAFTPQAVGTSSTPQKITLTNLANVAGPFTGVRFTGANPVSFTQTNNCGATIAANASCSIEVTFTPKKTGSLGATMQAGAGGMSLSATLSGTGK